MSLATPTDALEVGQSLTGPGRLMSRERMRWYCDALETAAHGTGEFVVAGPTIHSDDAFAAQNGLPGIIADGMISVNWISAMLFSAFGMTYLEQGELQAKFIRPVFEDEFIETRGIIEAIEDDGEGHRLYVIEVWCETAGGEKCTVGRARVPVLQS